MDLLDVDLGPGVTALVTTRAGGVSGSPWDSLDLGLHVGDEPAHVRTNRDRVAAAVGRPVAYLDQVHGADVHVVSGPAEAGAAAVARADAAVTAEPGVALAVMVADCVPVLLADGEAGVVAVAHAGRLGVQRGVVPAVLEAMVRLGARADRVRAVLGPSICGRCYEVGAHVQAEVVAVVPQAGATTAWGTPSVDLVAGVLAQLGAVGVRSAAALGVCTREDPRFYSHRRDGVTGRFAGVVALGGRDTPRPPS